MSLASAAERVTPATAERKQESPRVCDHTPAAPHRPPRQPRSVELQQHLAHRPASTGRTRFEHTALRKLVVGASVLSDEQHRVVGLRV